MIGELDQEHDGEVSHASVTLIPGDEVDGATLVYFPSSRGMDYHIKLYYPYREIPDVPVSASMADDILVSVNDGEWEYTECQECPCDDD